jgi:uncharacterized delta-60 repeat protein
MRLTALGDTSWTRRYNGVGAYQDRAHAIAFREEDGLWITGESALNNSGWVDYDVITFNYSETGIVNSMLQFDGSLALPADGDGGYAIDFGADGSVYIGGIANGGDITQKADYLLIKYLTNNSLSWAREYNGPVDDDDGVRAVALDPSGNIVITGLSAGSSFFDWATIKYAPSGDTLWLRRFTRTFSDEANDLVIDAGGNIYVAGFSSNAGGDGNFATIKYLPNGDTAWLRTYDPGPGNQSAIYGIALDPAGNVYVTGRSTSSGQNDFTTIKYTSLGLTDWIRSYNGTGNGEDIPRDVVVDAAGTAYVTGYSVGSGSGEDILTIAYSPTGDTLWTQRYNGPGNGNDQAYALTIDSCGNVYVAGYSTGNGTGADFTVIKYAQAADADVDGISDVCDNCLITSNTDQTDSNSNGIGDLCEIGHRLKFMAFSPVDLVITDPKGDSIGKDFNTIGLGSAYDTTADVNSATLTGPDGDPDDSVTIEVPMVGDYQVRIIREGGTNDSAKFTLTIRIDGNQLLVPDQYNNVAVAGLGTTISDTYVWKAELTLAGDVNCEGSFTSADIIYLVNYVFKSGPAPCVFGHGDVNCDGATTSADIIYMVNFVFKSGPPPCSQTAG